MSPSLTSQLGLILEVKFVVKISILCLERLCACNSFLIPFADEDSKDENLNDTVKKDKVEEKVMTTSPSGVNRRTTVLFGKKNKQSPTTQPTTPTQPRKGPGRPPKNRQVVESEVPASPGPETRKRSASTASLDNSGNSPAAKRSLTYADGPCLTPEINLFTTVHKESFLQYRSHSLDHTDVDSSSESGSTDESTSECGDSKESSSENGEGGDIVTSRYIRRGQ